MTFIDVRTLHIEPTPGRVYLYEAGFQNVYRDSIDAALNYFSNEVIPVLNKNTPRGEHGFFLAALWGNEDRGDIVADLFGKNKFK